jgi:UDP-2-acetamido-2-deoxy-ribo-hexuluronate aminotransferase
VFVDIDPRTYNLDPDQLGSVLSARVKAIIPVSLFGQMADYERINQIAQAQGIPVIEDAAQSFGARRNGKPSCGVTAIASTSFFPAKPFGCYGDGGALFTNDAPLAEKMRAIRTHGGLKRHVHPLVGTNGRFDTLQAAVLLAKWPHFDWELQQREKIGSRYSEKLGKFCEAPQVLKGNTHVYAQYTVRLPNRDRASDRLKAKGIPTGVYYPKCLHEQPVFGGLGYRAGAFPHSEKAAREVLSLPMHPFLTEEDQDRVIAGLQTALD